MSIVDRLRFDAARCEAQFSKGVAGNIEEAAETILVLSVLLGQALSSRAPDYVEVEFPGWTERVKAALLQHT